MRGRSKVVSRVGVVLLSALCAGWVGCASRGSERPFDYAEFERKMDRTVPGLSDSSKREIFEFHQAHPEVELGKNLAQIWKFRGDFQPALTKGDIAKMWEFHVNHPDIEFGSMLAEVWSYHRNHPQFGDEDLLRMWRFRKEHPQIDRHHLADMWQYHMEHPNQGKDEFHRAYRKYTENPEAFRREQAERQDERKQRSNDR